MKTAISRYAQSSFFLWLCMFCYSLLFLSGCNVAEKESMQIPRIDSCVGCYAVGFSLSTSSTDTLLRLQSPLRMRIDFADSLQLCDTLLTFSQVPQRIVCLSTTHIAFLQALNAEDKIVGIAGTQYATAPKIREAIEAGRIRDVGQLPGGNIEQILALEPDLVLAYSNSGAIPDYYYRLRDWHIPVLVIDEYLENHPLGRAEWLKVFAFLFHKVPQAEAILDTVAAAYSAVTGRFSNGSEHRPSVLINAPWKEQWYIPGARSYVARLVQDAGGELLFSSRWNDAQSHAIHFEEVLVVERNADFWLHPGTAQSMDALSDYSDFRPFHEQKIYNNTKRYQPLHGNDFYESGVLLPHIILQDLQQILHPELSDTSRELYFYEKLVPIQ